MDATRFPLCWPAGRPRSTFRTASAFKVQSFARVRDDLLNELKLMRVKGIILSTNCRLREDGLPLANQPNLKDPGVAVYFTHKDREVCFVCDRWSKIEDNLQAIRHTINALRGIARWGTGDMVDAAFSGFAQLPAHAPPPPWYVTLEVPPDAQPETVEMAYRGLTLLHHPDRGGDTAKMADVNAAYARWKKTRGPIAPTEGLQR